MQCKRLVYITSRSAIAERPSCRVGYLRPKVEDWDRETIFMDIIGLPSTAVTYLASKVTEIDKKGKIRAITPFKVIQGHRGRYQSKARMQISKLIVTDILSRTVSELSQLIVLNLRTLWRYINQFLTFNISILDTAFLSSPSGTGLRDNVRCSSWAQWKARSAFPISINCTFSLGSLRFYGRKRIKNRRFRSNAITLTQNFR